MFIQSCSSGAEDRRSKVKERAPRKILGVACRTQYRQHHVLRSRRTIFHIFHFIRGSYNTLSLLVHNLHSSWKGQIHCCLLSKAPLAMSTSMSTSVPTPTEEIKPKDEEKEETSSISAPAAPPPSALGTVLLQARRDLWSSHPRFLPILLDPLREYIMDPGLAISSILFPALLSPKLDALLAKVVSYTSLVLIHFLYSHTTTGDDNMREAAKNSLLHGSTGKVRRVMLKPPSDLESAFQGAVSFTVSAIGDIIGLFANPQKMRSWVEAMSQFNGFLEASGVGAELQEALMKPLLRGRLLDNFKILNDIQEQHHADRVVVTVCCERETIAQELKDGKRWMRFATAAYGTEMIRSAIDREVGMEELQTAQQAISVHTGVGVEDIKVLYAESNNDRHVLHHFVAVDHSTNSIVLALRGTLSLSGAIVDMQGMAADYCTGKAHKGIAEMADNVWKESGGKILKLCNRPEFQEYRFLIIGHSLGAGTACLLNLKLHVEGQLGNRPIYCYAFAPPPTFCLCSAAAAADEDAGDSSKKIDQAIQHTVAYIHDNDVVPFLSISAVRRLATLLDAVDNQTENIWFWRRWRIFHEYDGIPQELIDSVLQAEKFSSRDDRAACDMIIPARVVVWCKKNFAGTFQAYGCDPYKVAAGNVFLNQDMLSDHLPEQYEDALDALVAQAQG